MKKTIPLAAAMMLLTATGVFAQAATGPAPGGTMTKSTAPKTEGTKADESAAAKPKAHHRMAKNEAALNASEAQTTRQLNMEQSHMGPGAR